MKVKDLIAEKDYDYISYKILINDVSEFAGICHSENGKLISDDGDTYDEEDVVIDYKEWSDDLYKNSLSVTVKYIEG